MQTCTINSVHFLRSNTRSGLAALLSKIQARLCRATRTIVAGLSALGASQYLASGILCKDASPGVPLSYTKCRIFRCFILQVNMNSDRNWWFIDNKEFLSDNQGTFRCSNFFYCVPHFLSTSIPKCYFLP